MRLIAAHSRMHRLSMNGDHEDAHQLGLLHLAAAEALAPLEAAKVHNMLIMALGRQGRHEEARAHAQASLTLSRAHGDTYTEASVLNNLSVGYMAERRLPEAIASGEQALAAYQQIGSRYGAAIAMLNLALAVQHRGQLAAARDQILQLLPLCDAIGHQQIGAQGRCNLAGVLTELGQPQAALDHAIDGIGMAQKDGDRYIQATGHGAAFEACNRLGLWQQAIHHGRLAQAGLLAHGEPAESLAYEAGVAWALQQFGDSAAALAGVDAVLAAVAGRGGWHQDEADAAIACTQVLALQQDPRAEATLAAAHTGLMAQAASLPDPAERQQFLQATASRRDIQAAWDCRARPLV